MISKGALKEYLARRLDSFTWMKKLPADVLDREMRQFKVRPVFKGEPWLHQKVCFYIGCCYPQFLMLLDMGLGKTRIMLDLMTQRQREGKLKRGLVLVPRKVNLGSWRTAIHEYSDFEPNIISAESVEEKWEQLAYPTGNITVIDTAGLQHALSMKRTTRKKKKSDPTLLRDGDAITQVARQYSFFCNDESHKTKNHNTLRFDILKHLTGDIHYRYATTGTLFGRNPEDIWAQFFLIDHGETFGSHLNIFREAFFTEQIDRYGKRVRAFDKGMTRELYRFLHNRSIRYSEDECLDLPTRREVRITLKFAPDQLERYALAIKGLIQARGNLRELDAAFIRMRQIVAGFLEWLDNGERCRVVFPENPKLDALEQLIDESGDSKMVISHEWTYSGEMITKRLKEMGIGYEWLYGKSKDPVGAVDRFLADPDKRIFVMNSESGGTGTDGLQKQARYLVFYESPVSPITRQQVLKRVHRPGQTRQCTIYDLVMEKSVDLKILGFIKEGKDLHTSIVDGSLEPRAFEL